VADDVKYLLLNPFGFTQKSFGSPEELEAYIVQRFGGTTSEHMGAFRGIRRTKTRKETHV